MRRIGKADAAYHGLDVLALGLRRRPGLPHGDVGATVAVEACADATIIASDPSATLTDLREAVTTFEETVRIARRVFGVAHPDTTKYEGALRCTREELRARETPPQNAVDASS